MKSNNTSEIYWRWTSGKVCFCLWLTATVGAAQTEDQTKPLKFGFPGAQHAVDLLRYLIFSSRRGAALLHSNKICTATWQAEKWLKSVHKLQGASLQLFFTIMAGTNLILSLFRPWFLSSLLQPWPFIIEGEEWRTRTIQGWSLKKTAAETEGGTNPAPFKLIHFESGRWACLIISY